MLSLTGRKHAVFIVLTAVLSTVSLAIVCTAFGTQDWIRAYAHPRTEGPLFSNVNYGLFKGTLVRRLVSSPSAYDIYFTCVWGENSCAWSCIDNEYSRREEVERLVSGEKPSFACIPRQRGTYVESRIEPRISKVIGTVKAIERTFTNCGLWLSTIIFIVVLMIALLASIVLSMINCAKSPIETFFNVQGIYVANGIAVGANFFVLTLYGLSYDFSIRKDIAIFDTIVGDYASDADLGYSYWILLVPLIFEAVGIFLIAMRERIVNSDRAETKIDVATDIPETGVLF